MSRIHALLAQVEDVHHRGRPDLFKSGARKYSDEQLATILTDDTRPVFVACDEEDQVLGYAFCIFQQHPDDNILTDIRTLYIDVWMKRCGAHTSGSVCMRLSWIMQGNRAVIT